MTDGDKLARIQGLLAGIPGGLEKAAKAAMRRTVQNLRTNAGRAIRERYDISQANLRTEENVRVKYVIGNGVTAYVTYAGHKIPLYRYGGSAPKAPTPNKARLDNVFIEGFWKKAFPSVAASGHQLNGHPVTRFENAFVAKMKSGHVGIFERTGESTAAGSDRIRELMGSSIPQMLGSPKVEETLTAQASEKFNERLDVEVARLMNGW